ncbi:ABC transporter permease subunit [Acidocella aromatica]|uniref:Iron(III) transport system permease protein n=1 Tax=Acidocella aromatica TaxID=1303579 RepID=A0A840VBL5_9PROT|nr:iron(III) transport system permease protein [Acidocella aromatica]
MSALANMTAHEDAPRPALLLAAGAVSLLVLLPLAVTAFNAASIGWGRAVMLLWRPLVGELLVNTLLLIACVTGLCAVIGTAAAWLMERMDVPGRRVWAPLMVVPLSIPSFISSYAWLSMSSAFATFGGALLVVTIAYYPLVYLPVAAALREMDPALEETARTLGLSPCAIFWRVVLPQLRPALLGGMLLVAANTLVEFGAFALLRFRTFTTAIYALYRTGFSGAEPALLAMVLVLLCIACLAAEQLVRGTARYGRLARGARRSAARYPLGRWRHVALPGLVLFALISTGVPLGVIGFWLTRANSAANTVAGGAWTDLLLSLWSSVGLGLEGAVLTLLLALPLALLAARHHGWAVALVERCAYLGQSVPGIVVALALISLTVHHLHPLYQSRLSLLFAYAILFLPVALVSVRAALSQAQQRLEEAGRTLGLNGFAVLWRITLPLTAAGLGAAAAMVFIGVSTELTATLLLAPIGTHTLATQIWADTSTIAFAAAAPYAAATALLSMSASWLLAQRFGASRVEA